MDLLDRLLGHDAWTTRHLLARCEEVGEESLHRRFEIGHGSVMATLEHVVGNVEVWTDLMRGRRPAPAATAPPAAASLSNLLERFDAASAAFGTQARGVRDAGRWDDTYLDVLDDPPRPKSLGGTIVHVVTHNMAHRTEILHMLHELGVQDLIEGDALSWEHRHRVS